MLPVSHQKVGSPDDAEHLRAKFPLSDLPSTAGRCSICVSAFLLPPPSGFFTTPLKFPLKTPPYTFFNHSPSPSLLFPSKASTPSPYFRSILCLNAHTSHFRLLWYQSLLPTLPSHNQPPLSLNSLRPRCHQHPPAQPPHCPQPSRPPPTLHPPLLFPLPPSTPCPQPQTRV